MIRKTSITFMSLFFLALITGIIYLNATKPRVLVLHSYDNDYVWTREINVGLERIFKEHTLVDVRYHNMGTKKKAGKDYLRRAEIAAHQAIDIFKPNVLIAVDDYAQKLVAMNYVNHPTMSIVFAGVNGSIEPYGYDKANNVTGILERKPISALQEVISILSGAMGYSSKYHPKALFLSDSSHSTEIDHQHLETVDWKKVRYLGRQSVETFDEWKEAVMTIEERADFLLVGGYRELLWEKGGSKQVDAKDVMAWTEQHSPVPVIGMNIFNSEDGAMLSLGVSPYEQGEFSAKSAIEILGPDKKASDIPIRTSSQFVVGLRRDALKRREIELPQIFEAFARATDNYIE